jgi:hypothetical protein
MAQALVAKSAARDDKWELRTDIEGRQSQREVTLVDVDVNVNQTAYFQGLFA